jgi:hypothetical protein
VGVDLLLDGDGRDRDHDGEPGQSARSARTTGRWRIEELCLDRIVLEPLLGSGVPAFWNDARCCARAPAAVDSFLATVTSDRRDLCRFLRLRLRWVRAARW